MKRLNKLELRKLTSEAYAKLKSEGRHTNSSYTWSAVARSIAFYADRPMDGMSKNHAVSLMQSFIDGRVQLTDKARRNYRALRNSSNKFFESPEWMALRYRVLKKFGARCLCCGRGAPEVKIHVDHIKPRSKYPDLALMEDNLQVLCEPCNLGKRAWDETDWRKKPEVVFPVILSN
jgi:hypothetical protein